MQLKRKQNPMPMPVRPKLPLGGIQLAPRGPITKTLAARSCSQPCCDSKEQEHVSSDPHHHHAVTTTKKQRPSPPLSSTKVPPPTGTDNFHHLTLSPLPITSKVTATTSSLLQGGFDQQQLLQPSQNQLLHQQGQQQQQEAAAAPSQWDVFKLEDIIADEMFIPSTEPMVFDESIMSLGTEAAEALGGPGSDETFSKENMVAAAAAVVTTNSTPTLAPAPTPMPMPPQPQLVPSVNHNATTNKSSSSTRSQDVTPSTNQSLSPLNARAFPSSSSASTGPTSVGPNTTGGGVVDPHVLHRTILLFPNDANLIQTALLGGPPQAILTPTSPASGGPTGTGGFTYPLHMALCQGANLPVLQLLVQAGGPNALIQRDGHQGYTPLMLSLTILPNRPDVHQLLFRAYPQACRIVCHEEEFPLHVACRNSAQRNCIDLIHGLLADHPQAVLQQSKRDGLTPLQIIAIQDPSTAPHKPILYQALQQVAVTAQTPNPFLNHPAAAAAQLQHHHQHQQRGGGGGGTHRGGGSILTATCS